MINRHTIYALSTPFAKSGVAVIRVSGQLSREIFQEITRIKDIKPRFAYFANLYDNEYVIDQAIAIFFKGPNSFTGEDIAEFQIHGGKAVIQMLLDRIGRFNDVMPAEPGEFSKRAFYNNKMDLTQMEGLADLIDSETKMQQIQAIRQMQGHLGKIYDSWRIKIIDVLALIEAFIDFPEEDIPEDIIIDINIGINELKQNISRHLLDNQIGEKLRSGIKVAIVGAPNAGKSTLLNAIAKRDIAITSEIAGTTRDAIEVAVDIAGYEFIITDTAGIRESSDIIESMGIKIAEEKIKEADLVIELFDYNNPVMIGGIDNDNIIKVANKCDYGLELDGILCISALKKHNVDILLKKLEDFARENFSLPENPVITRARYRVHLENALEYIELFNLDKPIELAAEDLRKSAFEIGKITGHISVDDILDKIFSSFCIGK